MTGTEIHIRPRGPTVDTRAERREEPTGGSWWRARVDVPEHSEASHRRGAVPAGRVLLVTQARLVDDILHTVVLAPHPTEDRAQPRRYLAAEFDEFFEPAPDGPAVRGVETAEVQARMIALQSAMLSKDDDPVLLPPPIDDVGASIQDAVRSGTTVATIADGAKATAVARIERLNTLTKEVMKEATLLARFVSEVAQAPLAAMSDVIEHAERVEKGVRSLSLYTGEDVDVFTLTRGDDATTDEPLTIYQRRLFMDEEVAVHSWRKGIGWEDMRSLPDLFSEDRSLIERIAPSPRSIVLMRLRREHRELQGIERVGDLEGVMEDMRLDKQSFLLIRNGGNVHIVTSPLVWSYEGSKDDFDANGLVRLFPSTNDLDQPFRGISGRSIGFRDLDYTDARRRFDDRALAYKRLLILIMGLNDRLSLFGDMGASADWTDLGWQGDRMRFVRDDEMAIEHAGPSWREFVDEANSHAQPGSRVMVAWKRIVNPATARNLYDKDDIDSARKNGRSPALHWRVEDAVTHQVSHASKGRAVVSTNVVRNGKTRRISIDLRIARSASKNRSPSFLCMDAVDADELERHIESRRDRVDYLAYLGLMCRALDRLRQDDQEQARPIAELTAACAAGRLGTDEEIERAVRTAVRMWRARNAGAPIPGREDRRFVGLMDLTFMLLGRDVDLSGLVADLLTSENRMPLRLVIDGTGEIAVYATPTPEEILPYLGRHDWTLRIPLRRSRGRVEMRGTPKWIELSVRDPSEAILREWPASIEWKGRTAPARVGHDVAKALGAEIDAIPSTGFEAFSKGRDITRPSTLYGRMLALGKRSGGGLSRVADMLPFGLCTMKVYDLLHESSHLELHVLCLNADPISLQALVPEVGFGRAMEFIRSNYKHPDGHETKARRDSLTPDVGVKAIPLSKWEEGMRMDDSPEWIGPWLGGPPTVQEAYVYGEPNRIEVRDGWRSRESSMTILWIAPQAKETLAELDARWAVDVAREKATREARIAAQANADREAGAEE